MSKHRYITAGGDDPDSWPTQFTTITVFEPEEAPLATGLFDAGGRPLYRVASRRPTGFDLTSVKKSPAPVASREIGKTARTRSTRRTT